MLYHRVRTIHLTCLAIVASALSALNSAACRAVRLNACYRRGQHISGYTLQNCSVRLTAMVGKSSSWWSKGKLSFSPSDAFAGED